jgi:hypothetical protein
VAGITPEILDPFLRTVRARSDEHWSSLEVLLRENKLAVATGLLRQEIDTFVRLVYLESLDDETAAGLIVDFMQGKQWTRKIGTKKCRITDREMVNAAKASYFWVEIAYEFGCKLIHLSKIHDYRSVDPFSTISPDDKRTIINFLRAYHQYQRHDIDLPCFVGVLPKVMEKIRGKVDNYSSALEKRKQYLGR